MIDNKFLIYYTIKKIIIIISTIIINLLAKVEFRQLQWCQGGCYLCNIIEKHLCKNYLPSGLIILTEI